ncbi:hypothetical protein ABTL45_19630, partial [Acinetobacter baumannii]
MFADGDMGSYRAWFNTLLNFKSQTPKLKGAGTKRTICKWWTEFLNSPPKHRFRLEEVPRNPFDT